MGKIKFFIFLIFLVQIGFSLNFQSVIWINGNSYLSNYKANKIYCYSTLSHKLFIYKILNTQQISCAKPIKYNFSAEIVFDTPIKIETYQCGKVFLTEDKELGITQVSKLEKVVEMGKYRSINLKSARIQPRISKMGTFYWYGIEYYIITKNKAKHSLVPLEIPSVF